MTPPASSTPASSPLTAKPEIGVPPIPFFQRLRVRFLLLIGVPATPLLLLIVYTFYDQTHRARTEVGLSVQRMTHIVSQQQDRELDTANQLMSALAQMERWRSQSNTLPSTIMFSRLLDLHPNYATIGVAGSNGNVIASGTDVQPGLNLSDRPWFQKVKQTREFSIGEFQIDRALRKPTLWISYPILDRTNGVFLGALYISLDLSWVKKFAAEAQLPEGSSLVVLDASSRILFHYPDTLDSGGGRAFDQGPVLHGSAWREQAAGFFERQGQDGVPRLYSLAKLVGEEDSPELRVAIGIPSSAAFAVSKATLQRNLLSILAVILVTGVLAWMGTERYVVRWLKPVTRVARELHSGNLEARTGLPHQGGELGLLAASVDEMAESLEKRVSERKQVESRLKALNEDLERKISDRTVELQRSNRELAEFAYAASHDLQEPLRMIAGHLQLLERRYKGRLGADADDYIHFAVDGAQRMDQLILDLLAYSRVGTQAQVFVEASLDEAWVRARENLTLRIEESKAVIRSEPMPVVLGDLTQLTLVFQNLVGNAIKFRGAELPVIDITCEPAIDQPDRFWMVEIRDNGIGIPSEHFERVFQIFQRLHTREQYPGTGIGLAICKRVVERHGGKIWLESTPGKGTAFFFTLRRVPHPV